jgi:hypothetical protein
MRGGRAKRCDFDFTLSCLDLAKLDRIRGRREAGTGGRYVGEGERRERGEESEEEERELRGRKEGIERPG